MNMNDWLTVYRFGVSKAFPARKRLDRRDGPVDAMDPPGRSRLRGREPPGGAARGAILCRGGENRSGAFHKWLNMVIICLMMVNDG